MTDEELIARLRAYREHDEGSGGMASFEVEECIEAADRIEALIEERDEAKALQSCGCSYDTPIDVCLGHHRLFERLYAVQRGKLEAKLAKGEEVLRDLTKAFTEKVDVEQTRWKMPYEHPLSAYDRAVAFLKGDTQ